MKFDGLLYELPKELKWLIGIFLIILSIGFFSAISFVEMQTGNTPRGITENYLGNESDGEAMVMKFKKTESEMLNIIHTHILSMSVIFFILGGLVALTKTHKSFKKFLMIEPLLSVLFTFGGIWFLWQGHEWIRYVVMISGILMTLSFALSVLLVLAQLFLYSGFKNSNPGA